MDKIEADMRTIYSDWRAARSLDNTSETWQAFQAGWAEALLYAAKAREAERRETNH